MKIKKSGNSLKMSGAVRKPNYSSLSVFELHVNSFVVGQFIALLQTGSPNFWVDTPIDVTSSTKKLDLIH